MEDISLFLLFLSVLGGYLLGIISGLLPGIHNNNFALALVALAPFLAEKGLSPFYVAVIILSNALSQTFHDIIPSIFLGAPDGDTTLTVLPGHRLLIEGAGAEAVCVEVWLNLDEVKYLHNTLQNVQVSGVTEQYDKIYSLNFKDGRYFVPSESVGGSEVVILGFEVAEKLFPPNISPVGKYVWMREIDRQYKMKVIGVLEKEGSSIIDISNDNTILMPFNYIRRVVDMNSGFIDPVIEVKPKEGVTADQIKDEIYPIMRSARNLHPLEESDFAVNEVTLAADALDDMFAVLNIVGLIIGGFSILVGGFGIANIMFVSVWLLVNKYLLIFDILEFRRR